MALSERERLAQLGAKQTNNPTGTNPPKFNAITVAPSESATYTIQGTGIIFATNHDNLSNSDTVNVYLPPVSERTSVAVICDYTQSDKGEVDVYHGTGKNGGINNTFTNYELPSATKSEGVAKTSKLFTYDPARDTWWVV